MPRHDNYPDDMRRYDHDPRSPEYLGPENDDVAIDDDEEEEMDEEEAQAVADDWDREMLGDDAVILEDHDIGNK